MLFLTRQILLFFIIAFNTNSYADNLTNEQRKEICIESTNEELKNMRRESPRQYRSLDPCTVAPDGTPIKHIHIEYKPNPNGDNGALFSEIYGGNDAAMQLSCIPLSNQLDIFNIRISIYYQKKFLISTNLSKARCSELKEQGRLSTDGKPKQSQEVLDMIQAFIQIEKSGIYAHLKLMTDGAKDKLGSKINNNLILTHAKSENDELLFGYKFIDVLKTQISSDKNKLFIENTTKEICNNKILKGLISMYGIKVIHEYFDKNDDIASKIQVNREVCRSIW